MSQPLPPPWEEHHTDDGLPYYHNPATQVTQWDFPAVSPAASPAMAPAAVSHSGSGTHLQTFKAADGRQYVYDPVKNVTHWLDSSKGSDGMSERQQELWELQQLAHSKGSSHAAEAVSQSMTLLELRSEMQQASKRTHTMQADLQELERKIVLYIRNRMEVQDRIVAKRGLERITPLQHASRLTPEDRRRYETLVFLMRTNPSWLARVAHAVSHTEQPQLVQLVIFGLYADMHDPEEDSLLLQLFRTMLQIETDAAADISTFMRANSPLTELLSKYNQREPGREALTEMLRRPLAALEAESASLNLEIDPLRVHKELMGESGAAGGAALTADEKAKVPAVAAELERRVRAVERAVLSFLDVIMHPATVESLPFGMRWIAKTILQLSRARFSDAADEALYSLVGGFVFLRYINPAIVAPESLQLVSAAPSRQMRRNLVIIAKVIQAMSNNVLFGDKERYMVPLNELISTHQGRMRSYFDRLIAVHDLSLRDLQLTAFLSTLRTDAYQRFVHINLNDLYFLHRLLRSQEAVVDHPDAIRALKELPAPPDGKLSREEDEALSLRAAADVTVTGRAASRFRSSPAASTASASPADYDAEDDRQIALSDEAAQTRQRLLKVLSALPLVSLSKRAEATWAECFASMREECNKKQSLFPVIADLEELQEQLGSLGLSSPKGCDREWAIVSATRDELRGADLVHGQVAKYKRTLARLKECEDELKATTAKFEETLDQMRRMGSAPINTAGGAASANGGGDAGGEKVPGPFDFAYAALQKRNVITVGADDLAASGFLPHSVEPDERKRSKAIAKATFKLALLGPGELELTAAFKNYPAVVWDTSFTLDEFLKQRAHGIQRMDLEGPDPNRGLPIHLVNLLDLVNEKFVMNRK